MYQNKYLSDQMFFCLGVYDAVAHFNTGASAAIEVLKDMGLSPGKFCLEECKVSDKLRVGKANYKFLDENKKRRKILRGGKEEKRGQR